MFGDESCRYAWILVQHCPDAAFQETCLYLMRALDKTEVDGALVAYLSDRVLIKQGKKQRYGTQLNYQGEPYEIEDSDTVNERRLALGLNALGEYIKDCKEKLVSC